MMKCAKSMEFKLYSQQCGHGFIKETNQGKYGKYRWQIMFFDPAITIESNTIFSNKENCYNELMSFVKLLNKNDFKPQIIANNDERNKYRYTI